MFRNSTKTSNQEKVSEITFENMRVLSLVTSEVHRVNSFVSVFLRRLRQVPDKASRDASKSESCANMQCVYLCTIVFLHSLSFNITSSERTVGSNLRSCTVEYVKLRRDSIVVMIKTDLPSFYREGYTWQFGPPNKSSQEKG